MPRKEIPASKLKHIDEALREYAVPVSLLDPDPDNARTHPQKQMAQLREHLSAVGQTEPILYRRSGKRGTVMVGNARLAVAKELGWEYVAAIDPKLSDAEWGHLSIADNRSGELAGWDSDKLAALLEKVVGDLKNPSIPPQTFGFTDREIAKLAGATEDKSTKRVAKIECPQCGKMFALSGNRKPKP